ncbi:MAG: hypothetical protein ACOC8N_04630, partial [Spirochaetota bacterium]
LSSAEAALWLLAVAFVVKLGWEGFAAGEMGTMVGVFTAVWLLFLVPWAALKTAAAAGVVRGRRWAVLLTLILGFLTLPAGVLALAVSPLLLLGVMAFLALILVTGIACLRHPCYARERE